MIIGPSDAPLALEMVTALYVLDGQPRIATVDGGRTVHDRPVSDLHAWRDGARPPDTLLLPLLRTWIDSHGRGSRRDAMLLEKQSELLRHLVMLWPSRNLSALKPRVNGEPWGSARGHAVLLTITDGEFVLFGHRRATTRDTTATKGRRPGDVPPQRVGRLPGSLELPRIAATPKDVHPVDTALRAFSLTMTGEEAAVARRAFDDSFCKILLTRKDGAVVVQLDTSRAPGAFDMARVRASNWMRRGVACDAVFPGGVVWAHASEIDNDSCDAGGAHAGNVPFAIPDVSHAHRVAPKPHDGIERLVLYHGTTETAGRGIWAEGFRIPRECRRSWSCDASRGLCRCAMLGAGVYACNWARAAKFAVDTVKGTGRTEVRSDGSDARPHASGRREDRPTVLRVLMCWRNIARVTERNVCRCCGRPFVDHGGEWRDFGHDAAFAPPRFDATPEWVVASAEQVRRLTVHWST